MDSVTLCNNKAQNGLAILYFVITFDSYRNMSDFDVRLMLNATGLWNLC
jgi:hypothetical protein